MMMRLAFSIATVVNPEILIVDEILSVGDEFFQKKSFARMQELMSGGTTVCLFPQPAADTGDVQPCNLAGGWTHSHERRNRYCLRAVYCAVK